MADCEVINDPVQNDLLVLRSRLFWSNFYQSETSSMWNIFAIWVALCARRLQHSLRIDPSDWLLLQVVRISRPIHHCHTPHRTVMPRLCGVGEDIVELVVRAAELIEYPHLIDHPFWRSHWSVLRFLSTFPSHRSGTRKCFQITQTLSFDKRFGELLLGLSGISVAIDLCSPMNSSVQCRVPMTIRSICISTDSSPSRLMKCLKS